MNIPSYVIKHRIEIIIGFVAVAAITALQLRHVTIEPDLKKLLPDDMPSRIDTEKINELFGGIDLLFFVFETDDVLRESTLKRLKLIEKKIEKIDGVSSILSLISSKQITGSDGAMIVEPLIDEIPGDSSERERLRERIRSNELAYGLVVSKDFRLTALLITLKHGAVEDEVCRKAREVIDGIPGDEKVFAGGQPVFRSTLRSDIIGDLGLLVPVAVLVMLGILLVLFRQLRGVLLPFGTVMISMLFGMGLLPLFGWKITLISVLLPILVIAIANNYGIHIVAKYQELSETSGNHTAFELAAEVLRRLWKPVLICGLTTIAGILGLLSHIMLPARQIGIVAAIAVGFALAFSLLAVPAALSMMKIPRRRRSPGSGGNDFVKSLLSFIGNTVTSHPSAVLVTTVFVTVTGVVGIFFVKIDANQENFFSPSHPLSICTRIINKHFGGTQNISLLFHGDIKDPGLLKRIKACQDSLEKLDGVGGSTSMADVIRIMSRALNDSGDAAFDRIPPTRDAVAQYLELYSMSGEPDDFERMVDFNYENAHCIVRINNGSTPVVKNIVRRARDMMAKDTAIQRIGGFAVINAELADTIINGQITSLLFAIGSIVCLMILLFGSLAAGLLSAVPLGISAIIGFGIMGFFRIPLDIATALITSIVIGAGVDYTIHFLWRYRDELRTGKTYKEAVLSSITTTGRGILFNAISVVAGFSALFLSSLPPLRSFALLFSISIFTCLAGAIIVVPAICLVFKPKFLEAKRKVLLKKFISKRN